MDRIKLKPGQSRTFFVRGKDKFSNTFFEVAEHESYELICPEGQIWHDWWKPVDPIKGWSMPGASLLGLRVKSAPIYCLCACYNRDTRTGFQIGSKKTITITKANEGELSFFGNDLSYMYWNNRDEAALTLRRIS